MTAPGDALDHAWPTVVRPIVETVGGPILVHGGDDRLLDRLLALDAGPTHVVMDEEVGEDIAELYGERLVRHRAGGSLPPVGAAIVAGALDPPDLPASVRVAIVAGDGAPERGGWVSVESPRDCDVTVVARGGAEHRVTQALARGGPDLARPRVAELEQQVAELNARCERAERSEAAARELLEALQRREGRLAEALAGVRGLNAATVADLRAIASSLSWRLGHAAVRLPARLLRRPDHDAVLHALRRLERGPDAGESRR